MTQEGMNQTKEMNVLILDDEQNILNALTRFFADEPFGLFATTSANEAFTTLEREKIKVVISDQRMPELSGIDFLKQVKEKYPLIVRILFTGYADLQAAQDAINENEVYRFINKPWNNEELKATMKDAIARFDLTEENRRLFDITVHQNKELKGAYGKLKKMYDLQTEFTSTVSHELRTPLASMKTAIDIVTQGRAGQLNSDQTDFLSVAKLNVDRLNRLINDILDLSKLENTNESLTMDLVDLNQLVREVCEIQKTVAEEKGLYLKTQISSAIRPARMNPDKINQVLSNLITNAIKFTSKGGITVSTDLDSEKHRIRMCVADTGAGIGSADLPKLFQKFQQLGDPAKRNGGTGLGLAICKEIVRKHGGDIWVESQSGSGSKFFVALPADFKKSKGV